MTTPRSSHDRAAVARLRRCNDPWLTLDPTTLVGATAGTTVALAEDVDHHLRRVVRRRDGDRVVVSNGMGMVAAATVASDGVRLDRIHEVGPPALRLHMVQALGRQRKHEEVVRMLTEAAVDHITAVTTTRCQVDLSHKATRVLARWDAIATSAVNQSRRVHRPTIDGPMGLHDALAGPDLAGVLVAHTDGGQSPLDAMAAVRARGHAVTTWRGVVGPEGGLTAEEVGTLERRGARRVTLGEAVLRTEHAGLALAAVMAAALGRMDQADQDGGVVAGPGRNRA